MNILYYSWKSTCDTDVIESLEKIGNRVTVVDEKFEKYDEDERFIAAIFSKAREIAAGAVFSFNYFPDLSRSAVILGIPYVAWVYDSPHYTLESLTLNNECNHVYIFDYELARRYRQLGIETVEYLPLACNIDRLEKRLGISLQDDGHTKIDYMADITFLGRMYDDEQNFFSSINYLPEYIKGYLDGLMHAQENLYGIDLPDELLSNEHLLEIKKYVKASLGSRYRDNSDEIIKNMIRKQISVNERRKYLVKIAELFGDRYRINHYAPDRAKGINVNYKGYADYNTQMPEIFYKSKINLNISLRSIKSGIPLRVIDILGAGGFCLTNYQAELSEYFENGVDIVWYDSIDDMLEKIDYYLCHDEERELIAERGHKKARELFSYEMQLKKIFG